MNGRISSATPVPPRKPSPNIKQQTLAQKDFAQGPVFIDEPGVYTLAEDIVYQPFAEFRDIFDANAQLPQAGAPMVLGQFAAIVVAARNVEINLNGKSLSQSFLHRMQQRFFALIELSSSPFVPGQGPADFGPVVTGSEGVRIHNGTLGASAHHAIHGHNVDGVALYDLDIHGFEVAAIALNNARNVHIENVRIHGCSTDIPVNTRFSQAVFLAKHLDALAAAGDPRTLTVDDHTWTCESMSAVIKQGLVDTYHELHEGLAHGTVNPDTHMYTNPSGLLDGNVYGIVINRKGFVVNETLLDASDTTLASNISIKNVTVDGLVSRPVQTLALTTDTSAMLPTVRNPQTSPSFLKGAFGAVLDVFGPRDILAYGQALAVWPRVPAALQRFYEQHIPLEQALAECGAVVLPGLDSMAHVQKGNVGVFVSGANHVTLDNVAVTALENRAPSASVPA